EPRVHGLVDRGGGEGRGHVDHRDGRAGLRLRVGHGAEDRDALEVLARLLRIHARHEAVLPVGVVAAHLGVELPRLPRTDLGDDLGVFVDEDGHRYFPLAAATTFSAASPMLDAEMIGNPESARIFLPRSTFVPSRRTTSGTLSETCFAAVTTPVAITSHFMMP